MAQKPIELILLRELVSQMGLAVTMVDAAGTVVYFNQQAEHIIGARYEDTGEIPMAELAKLYAAQSEDGEPLSFEQLPIGVALRERRPRQAQLLIHDTDGKPRHITTTAIPLDGQGGTLLGAMAIFWESDGT